MSDLGFDEQGVLIKTRDEEIGEQLPELESTTTTPKNVGFSEYSDSDEETELTEIAI